VILDFTLTHTRYGSSHVHTTGQLTNTRRSDGAPELDGALREVARTKILHYHQLYINRPDPITFLPVEAMISYTFTVKFRLLSTKYRRNRVNFASFVRLAMLILKGSVGLILVKASVMRISIPLDLSSRPFIPLPRFICRKRPLPLLASSLVFTPRRSA
jgi:hypothetical protein